MRTRQSRDIAAVVADSSSNPGGNATMGTAAQTAQPHPRRPPRPPPASTASSSTRLFRPCCRCIGFLGVRAEERFVAWPYASCCGLSMWRGRTFGARNDAVREKTAVTSATFPERRSATPAQWMGSCSPELLCGVERRGARRQRCFDTPAGAGLHLRTVRIRPDSGAPGPSDHRVLPRPTPNSAGNLEHTPSAQGIPPGIPGCWFTTGQP
jgi:hypothetical protein